METPRGEDTPVVCRRLRAKGGWVPCGEPVTWEAGYISTAIFWCLGTADVIGPDDGIDPAGGLRQRWLVAAVWGDH
jgi:hypothetical protein